MRRRAGPTFALPAIALLACVSAATRVAAMQYDYAAVVCKGDRALVRFVHTSDDEQPNFSSLGESGSSVPIYRDLAQTRITNPESCRLADRRLVRLKQLTLDDSTDAMGGGRPSSVFSLWVGSKKIYDHVPSYEVERFSEIIAIGLSGDKISECRAPTSLEDDSPKPATCSDVSSRFRHPSKASGYRPGSLVLLRHEKGMTSFCKSLIRREASDTDMGDEPSLHQNWSAYARGSVEVILRDDEVLKDEDAAQAGLVDIGNDGKPRKGFEYFQEKLASDMSFWFSPSPSMKSRDIDRANHWISDHYYENDPSDFREMGYRIFAPDQTAYAHMPEGDVTGMVRLTPFRANERTWMLAKLSRIMSLKPYPTNIVLRPRPDGQMDEVCVFRSESLI